MKNWDYIIAGAGSAGCVLADRLSRDPRNKVLLLEAGGEDKHPLIHMPKGVGKLFTSPAHTHVFKTQGPTEYWLRGKGLGGSSSINGMMYFRAQPQDYDAWAEAAGPQWGWGAMRDAFRAIENHEAAGKPGAEPSLGTGGQLHISLAKPSRLLEAYIKAGEQMGVPRRVEVTQSDREGVAYATRTIWKGRRQSSARAFLTAARKRPNLKIITNATVTRVLFKDQRAVGVACGGQTFATRGEVILSLGALASPVVLQRSGIGPAELLQRLGIPVLADSPEVGRNMYEHRLLMMQYSLLKPWSDNAEYRGAKLLWNGVRYALARSGPLAGGSYDVAAFVRTGDEPLPDAEILMAPYSLALNTKGEVQTGEGHAMHLFGYPLRSTSSGSIAIASADPAVPAAIDPNYLADPYDQAVTLRMFRYIRRWVRQPALEGIVGEETLPGPALETDPDIIAAFRERGQAGYHACGTCRAGSDPGAVLDGDLRVRGVDGLRVVDGSTMPTMVSSNTNGPIMAVGWRAADLILGQSNN
jgi:choline dehydrogenase-like flavoprotein